MEGLVRDKFKRNTKAREILLSTGRLRLIFVNQHNDTTWGVCGDKGQNKLGKLLELVRRDALAGKDTEQWCRVRFNLPAAEDMAVVISASKGGVAVAEHVVEGKNIVRMGKLPENDVLMQHPSVSREHALLVVDRDIGACLVDLGASNGCFVNGKRLMPFVPERVSLGSEGMTFGASKRTYTLTRLETELREARRQELYDRMRDPTVGKGDNSKATVYVGNLLPTVSEGRLRDFFNDCGDIESVRLPKDSTTGEGRGIAFVCFTREESVVQALKMHLDEIDGRAVKVKRSESKAPGPHGGRGRGGGGGGGPFHDIRGNERRAGEQSAHSSGGARVWGLGAGSGAGAETTKLFEEVAAKTKALAAAAVAANVGVTVGRDRKGGGDGGTLGWQSRWGNADEGADHKRRRE
ncbi:unnamed protein product, partial [Discosporangium mesarthrocarpum]